MIILRQRLYADLKDVGWDQSKLKDIKDRQEKAKKIREGREAKKASREANRWKAGGIMMDESRFNKLNPELFERNMLSAQKDAIIKANKSKAPYWHNPVKYNGISVEDAKRGARRRFLKGTEVSAENIDKFINYNGYSNGAALEEDKIRSELRNISSKKYRNKLNFLEKLEFDMGQSRVARNAKKLLKKLKK